MGRHSSGCPIDGRSVDGPAFDAAAMNGFQQALANPRLHAADERAAPVCVILDGECPICALYARHLNGAGDSAQVRAIDGRAASAEKAEAQRRGYDLHEGFVALTPDGPFAGRDAMIWLATHVEPGVSWLLRLWSRLLRYELPASLAFPLFKTVRRVLLWCKGVGRLT